jgi:glycosyltransferase involved in cell wall biosynthesis
MKAPAAPVDPAEGLAEPAQARSRLELGPRPVPRRGTARARRVLLISSHFPPDKSAGTHRIVRITRHLVDQGWPIAVLTMDSEAYRAGTPTDERLLARIPESVAVHRTTVFRGLTRLIDLRNRLRGPRPTPTAGPGASRGHGERNRVSTAQRLADLVSELLSFPDAEVGWLLPAVSRGVRAVRAHDIEVIVSSAPPFTCHVVAGLVAKICRVKWVADFRDPWARAPWGVERLRRSWEGRARRIVEGWIVRRADAVVLNTAALREEFRVHYGPQIGRKLFTVTNGYDADVFTPFLHRPRGRHDGPVELVHAGTLYRERDPRPLLAALSNAIRAGRIPADGLMLHFVGGIADGFRVPQTIAELGLDAAVKLTPSVPHQASLEFLAAADVLVVLQPGTDLQVPVKLYEYLPFRKPILALAEAGAVSDLVNQGNLGFVVRPDDVSAIEHVLCELYRRRDRLAEMTGDEAFVRRFDGEAVAADFRRVLETV